MFCFVNNRRALITVIAVYDFICKWIVTYTSYHSDEYGIHGPFSLLGMTQRCEFFKLFILKDSGEWSWDGSEWVRNCFEYWLGVAFFLFDDHPLRTDL